MKKNFLFLIILTVSWIFTLPVFAGSYYGNHYPGGYYDRETGRGLYDRGGYLRHQPRNSDNYYPGGYYDRGTRRGLYARGGYLRHQPRNSGSLRSYGTYQIHQYPRYYMQRRHFRSNSRTLQQIYR